MALRPANRNRMPWNLRKIILLKRFLWLGGSMLALLLFWKMV